MSDYSIAIKIAAQLESSFGSALKGAQKGLSALGIAGKAGGAVMKATAATIAAAGTAIAGVGAYSVNAGKSFETAMSAAAATAGASVEEYGKMEAAALEMGKSTSKTAAESANALEYMALAGWDVDTSISALPSILHMSEASGMELARTSDLVTDSMAALGVSVEGLPGYLDVAARAQNKSNQTAEQLMEAYLGVGGVMKNLNVPIEESATALGVLANRGLKGSEAGTALNAVMINMTTGVGQAGAMMKKLGISAFDSEGNFIGLENALQQVNQALQGSTEEQRNAALAAIGGKHHVDALNALMAGLNETNAEGVTEWAALSNELRNAGGALEEMRDIKLDNLEGDMAKLQSAAEYTGIMVYKEMGGAFRQLAQYGTEQIGRLSDALEAGGFEGLVNEIGSVAADGISMVASNAPAMLSQATALAESFLTGVESNAPQISDSLAQLATSAAQALMELAPRLVVVGGQLIAGFIGGVVTRLPELGPSLQAGLGVIQGAFANLPAMMRDGVGTAMQVLDSISDLGVGLLRGIASGIAEGLPEFLSNALPLLVQFTDNLRQNAGRLVDAGLYMLMQLAQGIANSLPVLIQNVPQIVTNIAGLINDNAPKLINAGLNIIVTLARGIIQALPVLVQNLPQIVMAIWNVFTAVNWLSLGSSVITAIGNGIRSLGTSIPNFLRGIATKAVNFFRGVNWGNVGRVVINDLRAAFTGGARALPGILRNAATAAWNAFKSVDWAGLGKNLIDGIINGAVALGGKLITSIIGVAKGAYDAVKKFFGIQSPSTLMRDEVGEQVVLGMAEGMVKNSGIAEESARRLGYNTTKALKDAVAEGLSGLADTIGGQMDIFSKFDMGEAMSPDEMLSNMKSQIDGVQNWAAQMETLAERGIDQGLLQKLGDLGPQGLKYVSAFSQMTNEQLAVANERFAQSMVLPTAAAGQVMNSYLYAGRMTAQGFSQGMTQDKAKASESATDLARGALVAMQDTLGVHSPSTITTGYGRNLNEGLSRGIRDSMGMALESARVVMTDILKIFGSANLGDVGASMVTSLTEGFAAAGISFRTLAERLPQIGLVVNGIKTMQGSISSLRTQGSAQMGALLNAFRSMLMGAQTEILTRFPAMQLNIQTYLMAIQMFVTAKVNETDLLIRTRFQQLYAFMQMSYEEMALLTQETALRIYEIFMAIDLFQVGVNMVQGLINGMESMREEALAVAQSIAEEVAAAINSALAIASPSRVTTESGEYTGEGLIEGMENRRDAVASAAMTSLAEPIMDAQRQVRSLDAGDVLPRSRVIPETVEGLSRGSYVTTQRQNTSVSSSPQFVFSPSYHFEGTGDKAEVVNANRLAMDEFERMMRQYERKNRRTRFLPA